MGLLISIPVHEERAVVVDQLRNVLRFNPESRVIVHVSREFKVSLAERLFGERWDLSPLGVDQERVLFNPERRSTRQYGLVGIHLANYRYAREQGVPFTHFVIHASNDMYVREGAEAYVKAHRALARPVPLPENSPWQYAAQASADPWFVRLAERFPGARLHLSTCEGTAYDRSLMDEFDRLLTEDLRYDGPNPVYPDEESIFPSLTVALGVPTALPFVYSELTSERPLDEETIRRVAEGRVEPFRKRFYGDAEEREAYDVRHLYAVKRVPREFGHPLRVAVRRWTEAHARS